LSLRKTVPPSQQERDHDHHTSRAAANKPHLVR
jgi:hypothetical protein